MTLVSLRTATVRVSGVLRGAVARGRAAVSRSRRNRLVAGLLLILLLVAYLIGGVLRVQVDTRTASFLPSGDPSIAAMDQKARDFGGDPIVVVLRSDQPRALLTQHELLMKLLQMEGELSKLPDVASAYGPATVLNQLAASAQNLLLQIAGRGQGLRIAAEQKARAEGLPAGQVREAGERASQELALRYAPLVIRGLPVGLPTMKNPAFAGAVIYGPDGAPQAQWRFVAPDANTVAVLVRPRQDLDQNGTQQLVSSIRSTVAKVGLPPDAVTVSGVPAVTADLSGQIVREIPLVSALVALVVVLRYLLVPAPVTGRRRWAPLAAAAMGSAATFATFGWFSHPMSFGAMALLPLLLGIGSSFPLYLSVFRDRRPILVTAAASAVAFAALALSPLPFIRDLGLALALGVALTVVAALAMGSWSGAGSRSTGVDDLPSGGDDVVRPRSTPLRTRVAAALVAGAVAVTGWAALSGLDVQADPQELAAGLPALSDARTVERVLGSSGEVGVVLRGPDTLSPAALDWSRRAEDAVVTEFGDRVRPVLGPSGLFAFLGGSPTPEQIRSAQEIIPPYLSSAVVRPDRQASVGIFGLRLQDLGTQATMLDRVQAALPPPPPGYRSKLVGLPVAAGQSYMALLADRYVVNLAGIVLGGLVLAAGLRRRWDAVRAVAAAMLTTGWGFGALWVLGIDLSPLTLGLGALVTVTGCEFVVLLCEARRSSHVWLMRSVVFACVTSAAGYFALAVSGLDLVREFGLVLGAAVLLSYLAARLVVWTSPPAGQEPRTYQARETAPDPMKVDA